MKDLPQIAHKKLKYFVSDASLRGLDGVISKIELP